MDTYATGNSRTGHYRRPGDYRTYCGRDSRTLLAHPDRMCQRCVKAEAADRAAATTVAEQHQDGASEKREAEAIAQKLTAKMRATLPAVAAAGSWSARIGLAHLPAGVTYPSLQALIRRGLIEEFETGETATDFRGRPYQVTHHRISAKGRAVLDALTQAGEECAAHASADRYITRQFPAVADLLDIEARQAAALVTEAEATDGTWRGEWIGENTTTTTPGLFPLDREQGALFA
ncbi:hypothetical protein [Streptomyces mexicanus]|uniref:hypothetical protein n=1 Tax=Streptomyces mexicanus TaxID=178566 RepID=UPI00366961B3